MILAHNRPNSTPNLIDQREVILREKLGAYLHAILQIRNHDTKGREKWCLTICQLANELTAIAQTLPQDIRRRFFRNMGTKRTFPEEDADRLPMAFGPSVIRAGIVYRC